MVLLGGLCAYLTFFTLRAESLPAAWGLAVVPAVLLAGRLTRSGISTLLLVLAAAALLLALALFF